MAKLASQGSDLIYAAAERWREECLDQDGSLFTPGASIWTSENVTAVFDRVWVHGDTTPGKDYHAKLEAQLAGAPSAQVQLVAELNAVHLLSVGRDATGPVRKRQIVEQVLGWMAAPPPIPADVLVMFEHGLAHPGRRALQRRDTQISFLMRFAMAWKASTDDDRAVFRADPWRLRTWTDAMLDEPSWSSQRLMVLHLLHPDTFEPIVSLKHKEQIATRFRASGALDDDVDRELLTIRQAMTPGRVDGFSFYDESLLPLWDKADRWTTFMDWARKVREYPAFDADERDYKLRVAERLQADRQRMLTDDPSWIDALRQTFRTKDQNIVSHLVHIPMFEWFIANPQDARALLATLWDTDAEVLERIANFVAALPGGFADSPGNRLTVASLLLMVEDPTAVPLYRASAVKMAWDLAGWKRPPISPETGAYASYIGLCDEMVRDSAAWPVPLRDRLDAQSAIWVITKVKELAEWSDDEMEELLAYRATAKQITDGDDADGDTDVIPEPPARRQTVDRPDLLGLAAEKAFVDRSVLAEVVALLEDKGQVVFYGPPGTGKTFIAQQVAWALADGDGSRHTLVQFHPAMSYEDFVEGLRPEATTTGQVNYVLRPGHLIRLAERAVADPNHTYVMVIDEINRANLPKVLGELLFLLEYRGDEHAIPLLYRPGESFSLPDNLLFIGTMNTADRSIALIDAAMRRRFHFIPFFPHRDPVRATLSRWLQARNGPVFVARFLEQVNLELELVVGEHSLVGPSHFMKDDLSPAALQRIWDYNIFPLIEEHLWGRTDELDHWRWTAVQARLLDTPPPP